MAIKFQREKDALDALEALEVYVRERLTNCRLRAKTLNEELVKLNQVIKILENRANSLQMSKIHWMTPVSPEESASPGSTPVDAVGVITSILESSAGPMRARSVGEYAHRKGLITSSNGLEGVISIVSNKLSLHSPRIFTNVGWGWWDLTSRRGQPKRVAKPSGDQLATQLKNVISAPSSSTSQNGQTQTEKPHSESPNPTPTPTIH